MYFVVQVYECIMDQELLELLAGMQRQADASGAGRTDAAFIIIIIIIIAGVPLTGA